MILQRLGAYSFKVSAGEKTIAINPISKDSKQKESRYASDVSLVALHHVDFNGVELNSNKNKESFEISGAGEYEIQDIFIKGYPAMCKYEKDEEASCTIYSVFFDNISMMFLPPIVNTEVTEDVQEELYAADIIFVPIGGGNTLESEEAAKFVKKFSPRMVIPTGYDKKALEAFASTFGETVKEEDKLTLKKKDMEGESLDVVALKDSSK